jgi:succinate dehydrogenase / fumarate reductase flavoprotein subunit
LEENSLIELLVYGRIAGRAAAEYSAGLSALQRSPATVRAAEADVDRLLVADGDQNVRALLRSVRHLMTERAGVVRDETGLAAGLVELDEIEDRVGDMGVHIDIGGFQDLAYAYDLRSAVLAARATLECALERRETRGCHNRSDYPDADSDLAVNLVWSPTTGVRREPVPPIPTAIAELMTSRPTPSRSSRRPPGGRRCRSATDWIGTSPAASADTTPGPEEPVISTTIR